MKISGIYQIRNVKNGKVYIGSSNNINIRWNAHKRFLRLNQHHSKSLQRSWIKHGEWSFVFEILEQSENNLFELEQKWLDLKKASDYTCGYNISLITKPSSGLKGKHHSEESKTKIRNSQIGKIISNECKIKMAISAKGKVFSNETRLKISNALKKNIIRYRYRARITLNGKSVHLGYFDTENEAKEAYRKALT